MGFVFREFETPLKGSDFTPMIQLRLANKLRELGFESLDRKSFTKKNRIRVKNKILSSPEAIEFLIENIDPMLKVKRKGIVIEFLEAKLTAAQ